MGGLFKPWRIVGASITESELSDSISNILHHFTVAHSQSQTPFRVAPLKNKVARSCRFMFQIHGLIHGHSC